MNLFIRKTMPSSKVAIRFQAFHPDIQDATSFSRSSPVASTPKNVMNPQLLKGSLKHLPLNEMGDYLSQTLLDETSPVSFLDIFKVIARAPLTLQLMDLGPNGKYDYLSFLKASLTIPPSVSDQSLTQAVNFIHEKTGLLMIMLNESKKGLTFYPSFQGEELLKLMEKESFVKRDHGFQHSAIKSVQKIDVPPVETTTHAVPPVISSFTSPESKITAPQLEDGSLKHLSLSELKDSLSLKTLEKCPTVSYFDIFKVLATASPQSQLMDNPKGKYNYIAYLKTKLSLPSSVSEKHLIQAVNFIHEKTGLLMIMLNEPKNGLTFYASNKGTLLANGNFESDPPKDAYLSQIVLNEPLSKGRVGPITLLQILKFCKDSMNQHDRTSLAPDKQLERELGLPQSAYILDPRKIIEMLQREELIKFHEQPSIGGGFYYWKELLPKGQRILEKYYLADVASKSTVSPSNNSGAIVHPDEKAFEPMKVAKDNYEKVKQMTHAYQAAQNLVKPLPSGLTGWDLIQTFQQQIALWDASSNTKFSFKFWRKAPQKDLTIFKKPYTPSILNFSREKLFEIMQQKFPLLTQEEFRQKLFELVKSILPPLFPEETYFASTYPHDLLNIEFFRTQQTGSLPEFLKKSLIRENNPQDVATFIKSEIEAVRLEMGDQKIKLERLEQQLIQKLQQDPETSLKFQEMSLALRKTCLSLDEERLKTQDVDKQEELTRELTESLHQVDLLDLQGKYSKSSQDAFTLLLKNTQKQYRTFVEKSTQRLIQLNAALKKCEHLLLTQDLKDPQLSTALEKTMLNLLLSHPASSPNFSNKLQSNAQEEADRILEQKKQDDILLDKMHQLKSFTAASSSPKV